MTAADRPWWAELPTTSFGSPGLEERLAALIIAGRKRASAWNAKGGDVTEPGKRWVVTAQGRPVCVIETLTIEHRRFDAVDEAFAATEGEGDGSLEFWRAVHEDFFTREGDFAPDMLLCCETFRLVEVIDHALAAAAPAHVEAERAEAETLLAQRRARGKEEAR